MSPLANADSLRPGDFVVVHTLAPREWKYGITAGIIQFGTESRWNHAAVFVGTVDGHDKPQCVEARPGGAGLADADAWGDCEWSTTRLPANLTPTDEQRALIVASALGNIGTPYGWLDVVACGLAQERAGAWIDRNDPPWWYRRIASRRTLICSQLVDVAYQDAGIHLFQGHWPGLVSPGDLGRLYTH